LVVYLISTTIFGPNSLSAQLTRLDVFHLKSIQASPDLGYQSLP
jgi:hypothetical protein